MSEYIEPDEFEKILDEAKGERKISEVLKVRPQFLYWTFCRAGGHCRYMFSEFPLGSRYKADYVILNSYSGVWKVMFVELEPVDDSVFTKDGTPSKRLAGAIKQVDDWAEYYEDHKEQIRSDLVLWAKNKDILRYDSCIEPCNNSGDYLADPCSYLTESFHIVIGRRKDIDRKGHRRKATYKMKHHIEIVSYDRLLDLARDRYKSPQWWERENR